MDTIECMRELLSAPDRWTKGVYARDDEGKVVDEESDEASCWCLSGAAMRCDVLTKERGSMRHSNTELKIEQGIAQLIPVCGPVPTHLEELRAAFLWDDDPGVEKVDMTIVEFNDWGSVTFEDVRLVLEMANR